MTTRVALCVHTGTVEQVFSANSWLCKLFNSRHRNGEQRIKLLHFQHWVDAFFTETLEESATAWEKNVSRSTSAKSCHGNFALGMFQYEISVKISNPPRENFLGLHRVSTDWSFAWQIYTLLFVEFFHRFVNSYRSFVPLLCCSANLRIHENILDSFQFAERLGVSFLRQCLVCLLQTG